MPEHKISVIHNGVDVHRFQPGLSGVASGPDLSRKGPVIGFVGSFHYWHGISELSGIMEEILSRFPEASFLLVGDGPMVPDLKKRFNQTDWKGRVSFSGYVDHDDVPHHMAAMDIVLALYPKLDFFYYSPLKLFEYMAAGKPVVATGMGQIREVIEDGRNGFLFEPGLMDECIDKTVRLIKDRKLRERLGRAARDTMIREYTWLQSAGKIDSLMESVMKKPDGMLGNA